MKNNIIIKESHKINSINKIVFIVELNIQEFHKGDVFVNIENSLKFVVIGIGSDFDEKTNTISFLIEPLSEYNSIDNFVNKTFVKDM